jgi:hypothetical protein
MAHRVSGESTVLYRSNMDIQFFADFEERQSLWFYRRFHTSLGVSSHFFNV